MLRDLIRRAAKHGQTHAAVAVNRGGSGKRTVVTSVSAIGGGPMEDKDERSELTEEELEQQEGEQLPERTQMSVLQVPGHTLPGATLPVLPPEYE
jgi:hypothetical protein